MKVIIHRAHDDEKVAIDVSRIYEDSVTWTDEVMLNGHSIPKPYFLLKCQVDYSYATEKGLASGSHSDIAIRANIYLFKSDNMSKEYLEGYRYLCDLAGPKRKRSTGVPQNQPPCTKRILSKLSNERHRRSDIRRSLIEEGYDSETIRRAFKSLENSKRIFFSTEAHNSKKCEVWAAKT